jgi:flagellar hook assembly protein FlgD
VNGDLEKGFHVAVWDGRDSNGTAVGSGVYFSCLKAGKEMKSRKIVLLR